MADADVEIGWWRSVNAHAAATWFDRASCPITSRALALEYELHSNWQSKSVNICANLDSIIIIMKILQSEPPTCRNIDDDRYSIVFPNIL